MKPISIIIPVYNRQHLIVRALDSVAAQTYRPIELVVVDNASTDSSRNIVRAWRERVVGNASTDSPHNPGKASEVRNVGDGLTVILADEKRKGAAQARQTGFELSTSDVVLFFDSDDEMHPHLAANVMEAFDRRPDLEMVYWKTTYGSSSLPAAPTSASAPPIPSPPEPEGLPKVAPKRNARRFSKRNLLRRHLFNGMFATQTYALKADLFRRAGGWNVTLPCWNDWELGLRLLLQNPVLQAIPRTLVTIYPQAESITGVDFKSKHGQWEKSIEAMECVSSRQPEPLRTKLLNMLLYRRINLAALYRSEGAPDLSRQLLATSLYPTSPADSPAVIQRKIPKWRKWLLRFIYHYTSRGGRAAYLLWP